MLGVKVCDLNKSISCHYMVILIFTHKAAHHNLAGKLSFRCKYSCFRPQYNSTVTSNLKASYIIYLYVMIINRQHSLFTVLLYKPASQEVRFSDKVCYKLIGRMIVNLLWCTDL